MFRGQKSKVFFLLLVLNQNLIFSQTDNQKNSSLASPNLMEEYQKRNQFLDYVKKDSVTDAKNFLDQNKDFNINFCDERGWNALFWACYSGNYAKIVELLINYGADVNARDFAKMTPLMLAAKYGHNHQVNLLLPAGAHVDNYDINGKTAIIHATEYSSFYTGLF